MAKTKHVLSRTPVYRSWENMKARCNNKNHPKYERYGGRGISVCERWLNSFQKFYEDMGDPEKGLTLDRIDNEKGYFPGNCRWATMKQQTRNTRRNIFLEYKGERKSLPEWAECLGMTYRTLYGRIYSGWPTEKALTTEVRYIKTNERKR